jgi:hypothetical protein
VPGVPSIISARTLHQPPGAVDPLHAREYGD